MPLVRFGVRNEYGLGVDELYKQGVQSEDPKLVLDGLVVSGLVGLLRQLGDLSQFAADVFHGLQEQVASTSSRSRKLANRVQRIEASLPSIEKTILSQTDHLHFAYTHGTEWHASIRDERNHFICDDLPHFIMDSYEECREPPRLQLLDRFDTGGPGTCLKRYTDPTFFKRASSCSEDSNTEKSRQERKAQKIKKRSRQRSGQFLKSGSILNGNGRMQFSATGQGQSSMSKTGSTFDLTFKSDLGDQSDSRGSRDGTDFVNIVSRPSISTQSDAKKDKGLASVREPEVNSNGSIYHEFDVVANDKPRNHDVEATSSHASSATWDEKLEMLEHMNDSHDIENARQQVPLTNSSLPDVQEFQLVNQENDSSEQGSSTTSRADGWHLSTTGDESLPEQNKLYCGLNEVPHFLKPNFDLQEHHLKPVYLKPESQLVNVSRSGIPPEPIINGNVIYEPEFRTPGTGQGQYFLEADVGVSENESETNDTERGSAMDSCVEGGSNVRAIEWDQKESEIMNEDHVSQEDAKEIEWNHLDLGIVSSEHISERDDVSSDGRSDVNVIQWRQMELKTIDVVHVNHEDAVFEVGPSSEGGNDVKLIKWNEWELDSRSDGNAGQVQVIEWNQMDDIDSGTENFVDALNTIESESESDFELEMKNKVLSTAFIDEMGENAVNGQLAEIGSHSNPKQQPLSTSYVQTEIQGVQETALKDEEATNGVSDQTAEKVSHVKPEKQPLSTSYVQTEIQEVQEAAPKDEAATNGVSAQTAEIASHIEPENQPLSISYVQNEIQEVQEAAPKDDAATNGVNDQTAQKISNVNPEQRLSTSSHHNGEDLEDLESPNLEAPDHSQSSHELESTEDPKLDSISQIASPSNVPRALDFCTNEPEIEAESPVSEFTKTGFEAPDDERIISASHGSEEISDGSSTTYPHAFWTNGTLFGLQPSKPTVVAMPNSVDSGTTSKIDKIGQYSLIAMQNNDDLAGTPASSANGPENPNILGINDQIAGHGNGILRDHLAFLDPNNNNATPLESKVLLDTNVKNASSEVKASSEDRSSLLSLLSRGLLKNSLRRSGSLGYDESFKSNSPAKSNHSENRYQDDAVSKGKLSPPVYSPPPSPPLEHMKISFQPVDGFDTSRLKLKYPEGVDHIENTLDAFPSFQLVPESFSLQHDIVSDSDDDTFCRSHAYVSDGSNSHLSDSDSEQWESGNSGERNDPTLYNGLTRIYSAESPSISPRHEAEDHKNVHSLLTSSFGVPPPLPPLQWRVSRPQFDAVEVNQVWESYTLNQPFVSKRSDSGIAHPVLVDSTKLISTVQESSTIATPKKLEKEENFVREQTWHTDKEQRMDDGGDFLQQIRTKSFNLKRTEPTRSPYAPPPTTSNKITAILQKANAIRQAVGSDDDSWSDT